MNRTATTQQTTKFSRVERDAPIFMPFAIIRDQELQYDREELGVEFYGIINDSFEEVINKAVDLFVLASQSPTGFKLIHYEWQSNPKSFREEMVERYESLDDLQKAYASLDSAMDPRMWRERYGDICLVSGISMISVAAMNLIDKQIDKQLLPQKRVTWGENQVFEQR